MIDDPARVCRVMHTDMSDVRFSTSSQDVNLHEFGEMVVEEQGEEQNLGLVVRLPVGPQPARRPG